MRRRSLARALAAAVVALGAAGCSGGSDDEGPAGAAGYVAIGDSFTSGPGIAPADPDQPGCLRSLSNYPHLLASEGSASRLTDVSCGGETTEMLRDGRTLDGGTEVEPQLASIGRETTRVTVGIGANDSGATAGLYTNCLLPTSATDALCSSFTSTYMPTVFPKTLDSVVSVLDEVAQRAPDADVRLVGYLRIAPEQGQCAVLPLSETRRAMVAGYEQRLASTLAKAAQRAGVPYVDMHRASVGHDACAGDQAWVNGLSDNTATGGGAFLHPTAAGMRAVADQLGRR
ncbi:SGNH/GDSL hydrolase family protein [Aeromicrobium endophyticum]|uniref:SGNH/GDSL hydrolase family protein n=1 Tax=Aeromicrobium endophyticum TaxID=2292704 RepID=A0A371PBX0_9ACTN|nr:SGNH/GDSL hydrolase family protein [Aeromicrobium endophyticum]REK73439.1 SGNH/GDSL hydrolase family protein [Aeromicrobium endophyticum]